MRILVVHQFFLHPGQSGGSRFNELTRLWTEAGHDVSVIAGTVEYTTGKTPEELRGKWVARRQQNGVDVWRCYVPGTYSRSYAGRMWSFLGFTFSSACAALMCPRADVVIATSPPLTASIAGWIAAKLPWRRSRLIFEIRDLWPESAVTTGVLAADSWFTRLLYRLERWACGSADAVNVLTPAFRDDIVRRGLTQPERVIFVPNGADAEAFIPGPRENAVRGEFGWGDRTVFLYAGAHGRANALDQLLETAELLRDRTDILIALVGDGTERARLEEIARARELPNLVFCGPQPKERMADFVNAADAGMAVLQNNPTFRTVYPNKVFDYMACERPTVLAIDGVARELVCEQAEAGLFAEPENPRELAAVIRRLAGDPQERSRLGANGRRWVLQNATRDALANRYLMHMEQLIDSRHNLGAARRVHNA